MPELRQNLATREWVIIATERSGRPEDLAPPPGPSVLDRPKWEPTCPFCPGNEEAELGLMQLPPDGPWQVRVVRNKFPALNHVGDKEHSFQGVARRISGVGHHEVIVESPHHNTCPALESVHQIELTLEAFQERGRFAAHDPRIEHIIYFKNHGHRAGTSLAHPHAQLVAVPVIPQHIHVRLNEARHHHQETGRCVFCHMLEDELRAQVRIIDETPAFAAFVPYAAFSPFHIWIIPRRHTPNFLDINARERLDLAVLLRSILRRIYVGLNDPDFNYVVRSAPLAFREAATFHWYVAIVPRVSLAAGFELGSGMFINTTLPEDSAAFLRGLDPEQLNPAGEPVHP